MEGYYWRLWDPGSGRVVIALCGVCRDAGGAPWAVVALAAHPGGLVRWVAAQRASADADGLACAAFDDMAGTAVLRGSPRRLAVDLGPGARLEASFEGREPWPRRSLTALGPAQIVPGMAQYWHPHLLTARARGEADLGGAPVPGGPDPHGAAEHRGEAVSLDGWEAYAEKNWGSAFPPEWWWGQAGFGGGVMAAFAGGRLAPVVLPGGGRLAATSLIVRAGGEVLRFVAPTALVRAEAGGGAWRIRARSARHSAELEGDAAGPPHVLPVPVPAERRAIMRSDHHLAGRARLILRRGGRILAREETELAALEHGTPG